MIKTCSTYLFINTNSHYERPNKSIISVNEMFNTVLEDFTKMSTHCNQRVTREGNNEEPLQEVPMNRWTEIQDVFKLDWPRGVSACTVLETQRKLSEKGHGYGFKVFCPYGRASSGMVAFNETDALYEIIVQCPTDDTRDLEDALKRTKLIDWSRRISIPFNATHVIECIKRIVEVKTDVEIEEISSKHYRFMLPKNSTLFEMSVPSDISFGLLSQEHADLVNSSWPNKYPNSIKYFQLLISANSGYGLFRSQRLIAWVFINEAGTLTHLFTVDGERRKGYAELILMLVSNILLRDGREVFAFCAEGNVSARNLYKKIGFEPRNWVSWCYLKPKEGRNCT